MTEIAPEPVRQSSVDVACLDGRIAPSAETFVPATDDGLIRGDGVFEVIRVYAGKPFALADHLDRMERSAANLRLPPLPRALLEREALELLEVRGGAEFDGCLRLVVTRGERRLLLTEPMPASVERIRLGFVTYAPTHVLDGIKSLSYGSNMLASRLARERGFDEALLVTPHGRVLEAPTSSLFWVSEQGELCTPPLDDHVLASITRARVMELEDVVERSLDREELLAAPEAFLASTTREVQPIAGVEERDFGPPGPRTLAAQATLRSRIQSELAAL